MKLSAPPPPPPPPPEPPAPGGPAPDDPNAGANDPAASIAGTPESSAASGAAPGADASGTPEPAPAGRPPRPMRWPSWYPGVDSVLAVLVLVLAFGAASFVARNSDVWLHLAAGKRLLKGDYVPGSDPFSYSAADRPWVNHSWLADAFASVLYGGEGKLLVAVKALAVALAFGLLMALRRPQYPLWPWAVVTCVAVLAAAPQFTLRPLVLSMLFLAVTLFLLFRMPRGGNPWRFPAAIGVTFWLWANCDEWFFIGPLALALVLAGEFIQSKLPAAPGGDSEPGGEPGGEPLGALPDVPTLAKALAVGVVACMLTPHHVRIWELPLELRGVAGADADGRLRQLLMAPYHAAYYESDRWGRNLNGLAYAVLLVGGAAALGFGYGRLRVAHVALWVGFAALSLLSVYAIPLFAVVAVPLVAAQLNAAGTRAELTTWGDPRSRLLWIGSTLGRVASVAGVCALIALAYPGWVHPEAGNAAYARRVAWGVEPDPALAAAAGQLERWREQGALPPEARGFITNAELANHVAWFAPREKVFLNGRYNHHRRELPAYLAVRKGLGLVDVKGRDEDDVRFDRDEAAEVLGRVGAGYVAISSNAGEGFYSLATGAANRLYAAWGEWSAWYVDGRTTVFGWHPGGGPASPQFAALRVDPVALAFGPDVKPLAEPELRDPPQKLGWEEAFVRPAHVPPPEAGEALAWLVYRDGVRRRQVIREGAGVPLVASAGATGTGWHPLVARVAWEQGVFRVPPVEPGAGRDIAAMQAAPLLALRAARRAVNQDPDHPESYYALARALEDAQLPLSEGERSIGRAVALRQCLARLPAPENYRRGQFTFLPSEVATQLASVYLGPALSFRDARGQQKFIYFGMPLGMPPFNQLLGQSVFVDASGNAVRVPFGAQPRGKVQLLTGSMPHFLASDAAFEAMQLASKYAAAETTGDASEATRQRLRRIELTLKAAEDEVVRNKGRYTTAKGAASKLPQLVKLALFHSLPGEALQILSQVSGGEFDREYRDEQSDGVLLRVSLEMLLGRIELTHEPLNDFTSPEKLAGFEKAGRGRQMQWLKYQKCLAAGQYKTAGEVLEAIEGKAVGTLDGLPPLGPAVPRDFILASLALALQTDEPQKALDSLFQRLSLLPPQPLLRPIPYLLPAAARPPEVWEGEARALSNLLRQRVADQLRAESNYFYRRGMLALLEGDMPTARRRFEQSRRKPPAGWGLPDPFGVPDPDRYLELIHMAEHPRRP